MLQTKPSVALTNEDEKKAQSDDSDNTSPLEKSEVCIPNPPAEDGFDEVMKCIYGDEIAEEDEQNEHNDSSQKKTVRRMSIKSISKRKGSLASDVGIIRRDSMQIQKKQAYSPLLKAQSGRLKVKAAKQ